MRKWLLLNNLILGAIVVSVWVYDFFVFNRLRFKVKGGTMEKYKGLRDSLEKEGFDSMIKERCKEFAYKPDDVIYLSFVNFKDLKDEHVDMYIAEIERIYEKYFTDVFRPKIYVKRLSMKVNNMLSIVSNTNQDFYPIHTKSFNKLEIYLYKEFFDNQMVKKGNQVFIKTSKEKLIEMDFISKTIKRSMFYFKKPEKLLTKEEIQSKQVLNGFSKLALQCLKQKTILYLNSLEYVNNNKNLIFFDKYLKQIETESDELKKEIDNKNLFNISEMLLKNEYFIYDTVYMYEDYL